ncbi:DUF992 domain-containing protein [Sulfitobacter sp. BDSS02]|nr:DUF992 domain-containing protein [Sulfitobacter sp. BDSS02]MBR9849226.1 DUF992 domain-containing protein [Paracoccaceae bacterium]
MFNKVLIPAIGLSAVLLAGTSALAQDNDHTEIGSLSCDVDDGTGYVFGSSKELDCTFNPVDEGAEDEHYIGRINRYGIDIGKTQNGVMSWLVLAPTEDYGKGALTGSYGGVSAEATVGIGAGANVLIGGSDETIALQPISVNAQNGLNLAVGIADLTLEHHEM